MNIKELSKLYAVNIKDIECPKGYFYRIVKIPVINVYKLQLRRKALIGSWVVADEFILQHDHQGIVTTAREVFEKWA